MLPARWTATEGSPALTASTAERAVPARGAPVYGPVDEAEVPRTRRSASVLPLTPTRDRTRASRAIVGIEALERLTITWIWRLWACASLHELVSLRDCCALDPILEDALCFCPASS